MENMANNNWKITCLHYGTLSCYKSLFDGGLDQTRYPFVYSGYLLQKDGRNILVDTGVHQDNIVDGKAWADSPAEGGNQFVLDALKGEGLTPDDIEIVMYTHPTTIMQAACCCFPIHSTCFRGMSITICFTPCPHRRFEEIMTRARQATLHRSRMYA